MCRRQNGGLFVVLGALVRYVTVNVLLQTVDTAVAYAMTERTQPLRLCYGAVLSHRALTPVAEQSLGRIDFGRKVGSGQFDDVTWLQLVFGASRWHFSRCLLCTS